MQAAVAALDRGRAIREQREQTIRAVEQGDPSGIFRLESIAADIARIAARLDASADEAASVGQHNAHAALAAQLLRQAEMRARLGGYERPASSETQGRKFSVNIFFSTGETVSVGAPVQVPPMASMINDEPENERSVYDLSRGEK